MKHHIQLNAIESFARWLLDDVVAPLIPSIPDMECIAPSWGRGAHILDVPGITQCNTYSCGATASWSVISAMGWQIKFRDWLDLCHTCGMRPDQGMDQLQLGRAIKKVGGRLHSARYARFSQVETLIKNGAPVLFGQGADMFEDGDHWMYVYGFDRNRVYVGNFVSALRSKTTWSKTKFYEELTPKEIYWVS